MDKRQGRKSKTVTFERAMVVMAADLKPRQGGPKLRIKCEKGVSLRPGIEAVVTHDSWGREVVLVQFCKGRKTVGQLDFEDGPLETDFDAVVVDMKASRLYEKVELIDHLLTRHGQLTIRDISTDPADRRMDAIFVWGDFETRIALSGEDWEEEVFKLKPFTRSAR